MFERFTEKARRAVILASEEARLLNQNHIGPEHVLLGLIRVENGIAYKILTNLHIRYSSIRLQIEKKNKQEKSAKSLPHIPFTAGSKKVLELSLREAMGSGHSQIGTGHILLGLIREDGLAAQVLIDNGADYDRVKQDVTLFLSGYQVQSDSSQIKSEKLFYEKVRRELLELIKETVHHGPVTLASGKVSDFYIDMRLLTLRPRAAYLAANLIDHALAETEFDAIGGLSIGADPIVGAYCYLAGAKGRDITGFLIRKEAKGHGLKKLIEGPELKKGDRVVLVDDVVTSGGSIETAFQVVDEIGCRTVKALALVDREEGARQKIESLGIEFEALFTKGEIVDGNR